MENEKPKKVSRLPNFKVLLSAIVIGLGGFANGTLLIFPSLAFNKINTEPNNFRLNPEEYSWAASVACFGSLVGGLCGRLLVDRLGRKTSLMLTLPLLSIGWLVTLFAHDAWMVDLGHVITGLVGGVCWVCCPVYIAEIAQAEHRGFLQSFYSILLSFAIQWTYLVGQFLTWRWLIVTYLSFNTLMAIGLLFIPESPRWLLLNKYTEGARWSLEWFRGSEHVTEEMNEINENIRLTTDEQSNFHIGDLRKREMFHPLLLAVTLATFQSWSGISVMDSYLVSILLDSEDKINVYYQTATIVVVIILINTIVLIIIEKIGRRPLLMVSSVGLVIVCAGLAASYKIRSVDPQLAHEWLYWFPMVAVSLYFVFFQLGWAPIPPMMQGELLPIRLRGFAGGIIVMLASLSDFLAVKSYVSIEQRFGNFGVFTVYAIVNLIGLLFAIIFLFETKGKTLEQIEKHFRNEGPGNSQSNTVEM